MFVAYVRTQKLLDLFGQICQTLVLEISEKCPG